jgi:hypothetical protein
MQYTKPKKTNAGASCKPKQPETKAGTKLNMGGMMTKANSYSCGGMPHKKSK